MGKSDFKTALKWMTIGLIQSPNTLYRSEIGAVSGGMRQLSPYEIVTELAYTYTGTTPTDAMLTLAGSGNLGDVTAMARSLLATDAGKQALQRFFEQYLDYASVTSMQKPNISTFASVSADMVQETHAFIDQIVFQNAGGLKELLTATTTNPSKALATYYATGNAYTGGFPSPGTDYALRPAPGGPRHRRSGPGGVPVHPRRLRHLLAHQARPLHLLQALLPAEAARLRRTFRRSTRRRR